MNYRDLQFRYKDFERAYNSALEHNDRLLRLGQDVSSRPQLEFRRGRLTLEDLEE